MATVRDIIRRAFRLAGITAAGKSPTAQQATDALEQLQAVVLQIPVGRSIADVTASAAYDAGEDERVYGDFAINLPTEITERGMTRPTRTGAVVHKVELGETHMFANGAWRELTGLTLESDNPLGPEHDHDLAAMVAVYIAPEYGPVDPNLAGMAQAARTNVRRRFRQRRRTQVDPILWPARYEASAR